MLSEKDAARYWAKVDKKSHDKCWIWKGSSDRRYGQFWLEGKLMKAHRVSLSIHLGRWLSKDEHACHHCDNPPCVNPDHLFAGSMSDNIKDAVSKGRVKILASYGINRNREKTHCRKGHELSGGNISILRGQRVCLVCQRECNKKYSKSERGKYFKRIAQRNRRARAALEEAKHD